MSEYFPKPQNHEENIKIKIDLSNYVTKTGIKNITHADTSGFALKTNLSSLKTEVDKLDIDKLKPIPADLSKLFNVVKNDVVKKTVYNKLVAKVDNIDTSDFVIKTNHNTKITELENKIPDISNLATKTALPAIENKIPNTSNLATKTALSTVENKIPDTSNLATKTALTTVENKIPDTSNLVKKANYDAKMTNINSKFDKIDLDMRVLFDLKLKELIKNSRLLRLGDILFNSDDGNQAYLIFQPARKYFKTDNNSAYISEWKSKGLGIKPPKVGNNNLTPQINYYRHHLRVIFSASCLQQSKIDYSNKKISFYIAYELRTSNSNINDPTLQNCLFGSVTLTKNVVIDKYKYSGYGIGFDRKGSFSFPGGEFGQNVVIFGADMSSSPHIDNKGKDILVLGRGQTQGSGEN